MDNDLNCASFVVNFSVEDPEVPGSIPGAADFLSNDGSGTESTQLL
jgi:hypothetical protein